MGQIFFSSLPILLSSLTIYGGALTPIRVSSCLALGNLQVTLSSVGVFSQSCPEVAWNMCVALLNSVSCTFTGGPIYLG